MPQRRPQSRPRPQKSIEAEIANANSAGRSKPTTGGDQRSRPSPPEEPSRWQPSARDLEIYAKYCEGETTERELAAAYNLSKTTIHDAIRKVETYLANKNMVEIRQLRVRVTERMELIFAKAMQSFARSCEDAVTITVTNGSDGADGVRRETTTQSGNPAFLAQAREAMSEIMRVWGGYSPKTHKVDVHPALRVAGRTREEALQARIDHLLELKARLTQPDAD